MQSAGVVNCVIANRRIERGRKMRGRRVGRSLQRYERGGGKDDEGRADHLAE